MFSVSFSWSGWQKLSSKLVQGKEEKMKKHLALNHRSWSIYYVYCQYSPHPDPGKFNDKYLLSRLGRTPEEYWWYVRFYPLKRWRWWRDTLLSSCPASSCSASSSLNFSPRVVSRWRSSAELMKPFPSCVWYSWYFANTDYFPSSCQFQIYLVKMPEAFNEVITGVSGSSGTNCLKIYKNTKLLASACVISPAWSGGRPRRWPCRRLCVLPQASLPRFRSGSREEFWI